MKTLLLALVTIYRRALSPVHAALFGPSCRFEPTCSAYAEQALHDHGAWRGLRLAAWRLLRCQPFARGGFDPVPAAPVPAAPVSAALPASPRTSPL